MNKNTPLENLRNVGIIAHIDAGKTTTTEGILYRTGLTHKIGVVRGEGDGAYYRLDGTRKRARNYNYLCCRNLFSGKTTKINIIDTPGHIRLHC